MDGAFYDVELTGEIGQVPRRRNRKQKNRTKSPRQPVRLAVVCEIKKNGSGGGESRVDNQSQRSSSVIYSPKTKQINAFAEKSLREVKRRRSAGQ